MTFLSCINLNLDLDAPCFFDHFIHYIDNRFGFLK